MENKGGSDIFSFVKITLISNRRTKIISCLYGEGCICIVIFTLMCAWIHIQICTNMCMCVSMLLVYLYAFFMFCLYTNIYVYTHLYLQTHTNLHKFLVFLAHLSAQLQNPHHAHQYDSNLKGHIRTFNQFSACGYWCLLLGAPEQLGRLRRPPASQSFLNHA